MRVPRGEATVGVPEHQVGLLLVERRRNGPFEVGAIPQDGCQNLQVARVGALRSSRRLVNQGRADLQVDVDILPRVHAAPQVVPPGAVRIDEGFDRVAVPPRHTHRELRAPAVVAKRRHRQLVPRRVLVAAIEQTAGQLIVAVGEDVGLDHHTIAGGALDRKTPGVDLRRHPFDGHPLASVGLGTRQHETSFRRLR